MTPFVREVLARENEVDATTFLARLIRAAVMVYRERRAKETP